MAKSYQLIPAEVPPRGGRAALTSVYREIVQDFLKQKSASVLVKLPGRKTSTLYLQLRKAAKDSGANIAVVQRAGAVYIISKA